MAGVSCTPQRHLGNLAPGCRGRFISRETCTPAPHRHPLRADRRGGQCAGAPSQRAVAGRRSVPRLAHQGCAACGRRAAACEPRSTGADLQPRFPDARSLRLRRCSHHAETGAATDPDLHRLLLQTPIELAARLGYGVIVAPLAAAITFGGLRQAASIIRA